MINPPGTQPARRGALWKRGIPMLAPLLLVLAASASAYTGGTRSAHTGGTGIEPDEIPMTWGPREVEHVWNRAGFGILPHQIDRWVEAGPEALVHHLLLPRPLAGQKIGKPYVYRAPLIDPVEYEQRTIDQRRNYRDEIRKVHTREFARLRADWIRRMVAREDPLRDRLTLFWHGVFTSSYETVRDPEAMSRQHVRLRRGALGSYEGLLRAMLRDPAMLIYLNNDKNRKEKPNENLAREVMELFSLGEGSGYTEADVHEAARALTGASVKRDRNYIRYRFEAREHDGGEKSILGVVGDHRPDDLATILVAQPACATFVASSLLEYMEGVKPEAQRVEAYAQKLRATGFDIAHFMRALLLDPAFYSDEVIGARIASPVDYLIGTSVRLGGGIPSGFLVEAAAVLGQDLFRPPNVKGWEEGIAWISTASFMQRGNIAGAMVGRVDRKSVRQERESFMDELEEEGAMAEMSAETMEAMGEGQAKRDDMGRLTKILKNAKFKPRRGIFKWLRENSEDSNGAIVAALADRLLAVEPPVETLSMLEERLKNLRLAAGEDRIEFLARTKASEPILRELCHFILSLPEAQLH